MSNSNSQKLEEIIVKCKELAQVPVAKDNVNELASGLLQISAHYYGDALDQSQKSFKWALRVAIVGMVLFFTALVLMMAKEIMFYNLSLIGGVLTQIISGIMFYLYAQTTKQLFSFHVCLERANRFLITNAMCESLNEGYKDETRQELIRIIATAPVLSRALVKDGETCKESEHGIPDERNKQTGAQVAVEEASTNGSSHPAL